MARNLTRRQFLKRSAWTATAATVAPGLRWIPGTSVSYAGGPGDAIVVYVVLDGGNDGINTVYPLNGNQRTLYEDYRSVILNPNTVGGLQKWQDEGFPVSALNDLGVNDDGNSYALHPSMTALYDLYTQGKVAVVNGVHYPHPDHSHFRSTEIWETGDPEGALGQGWFGKYLNYAGFAPTDVPAVIMADSVSPLFSPTVTSLFAFRRLSDLQFPAASDGDVEQAIFRALCDETDNLNPALYPELVKLAQTGIATIDKMQEYYKPGDGFGDAVAGKVEKLLLDPDGDYGRGNDLVYGSPLNDADNPYLAGYGLARDMRHVAAAIRANVGARFFYVRMGGFDSHSSQEDGLYHSYLLQIISESMAGLYNELQQSVSLPPGYTGYLTGPLHTKVILVTFSEFGRTIRQNAYSQGAAGTDHATASPHWVVGDAVQGGQYGAYPALDDPRPSNGDDLKMVYDIRDLYGTILARWLNVPLSEIGPGPGKMFAATTTPDEDGNTYTSFNAIPFLLP